MTDADVITMSAADIKAVLNEVVPGGDAEAAQKIYGESYRELMETLRKDDEGNIRGLMSQAIVPRLIRQMAKIPQKKRTIESELKDELTLEADRDITPDYPYARTQIIEVWAKIKTGKDLNLYEIFKDPLLVTAVEMTNTLMGEKARELNTQIKRKEFSLGVNKIQDVILRNMIQDEQGVIPMIGDTTSSNEEGSAFGFGENPNPEVAAILNRGLVMDGADQKQYHKELATLAKLISPKEQNNLVIRSVKDAFVKVGFEIDKDELTEDIQVSKDILTGIVDPDTLEIVENLIEDVAGIEEAKGQTVIGGLKASLETAGETIEKLKKHIRTARKEFDEDVIKIKELELENEERGTALKEFKKERKEAQQREKQYKKIIADLNEQLLLSGIKEKEEEEEAPTDYNTEAMLFLIGYLGVSDNLFKFTKNWMELYALKQDHKMFSVYREDFKKKPPKSKAILTLGLSKLIAGQEYVSVRKSPKFNPPPKKKPVKITHKDMIAIWPDVDHRPTREDLIVVKVNAKLTDEAKNIVENFKEALRKHKQDLLSSTKIVTQPFPTRHAGFDNISSTTESRRRRRNKKDERVLIW